MNVLVERTVTTGRTSVTCETDVEVVLVEAVVAKPVGTVIAGNPPTPTPAPAPIVTPAEIETLGRGIVRVAVVAVAALLNADPVRVVYVGMPVALLEEMTVLPPTTATMRLPT